MILPIILFVGAVLLLGYEAYEFLQNGSWELHTLLDFEPLLEWLMNRRGWVGLKKVVHFVLSYLPAWLAMFIAIFLASPIKRDMIAEYHEKRQEGLKLQGGT